jgi:hypothetical protein
LVRGWGEGELNLLNFHGPWMTNPSRIIYLVVGDCPAP